MICPNCQTIVECPSCEPERKTPEGCVCEPDGWTEWLKVWPHVKTICGNYVDEYGACQNCSHDEGCHKGAK